MTQYSKLIEKVIEAGDMAAKNQKSVRRNFKPDGSVLTETDLAIDQLLSDTLKELFPDANIVSEENPRDLFPDRKLTFALDPIDGTDAYSQGMPGWCVALGILNEQLLPVGGIIYAPRWGTDRERGVLLTALPDQEVLYNGSPLKIDADTKKQKQCLQMMISSKLHRTFDLSVYPGKLRSIGSSILHLAALLLHPGVTEVLLAPCFIWDIAAAHAIIKRKGFQVSYLNGKAIDYSVLIHRKKAAGHIVAGTNDSISALRSYFTEKQ
ncbi:inositol monophosphatase family protein [Sediminispirochaeta smaragdinae]|uniref:Inositol monophosphatase n=1 Tax=Sediminispirochaeta smaragdinae (strain DSM 11293 / JCM 15392 / SEBR 4228) TaxID=573413 RepID=E1R5A3_SEDSS|nr:inositol monophosphatase family protein [Sediminispirochaeta smaragdinae]ADK82231.1 inositol monophosphatase [Sediminispirochaeta smaragdinae DSM 11293]